LFFLKWTNRCFVRINDNLVLGNNQSGPTPMLLSGRLFHCFKSVIEAPNFFPIVPRLSPCKTIYSMSFDLGLLLILFYGSTHFGNLQRSSYLYIVTRKVIPLLNFGNCNPYFLAIMPKLSPFALRTVVMH
jgi:hypothetical protein